MGEIWYLSPSNQSANLGAGTYGSEKQQMELLVQSIVPHLQRAAVAFHVADSASTIQQRAKQSNELGTCFHLALHSNAGGNGRARGAVAYYYSERGKQIGENLVAALSALGQESNRHVNIKQDKTLYELRKTTAPACLLEVDFHDNPAGADFVMSRRDEIAEAIARVIIEADGKGFVPAKADPQLEEAVRLGLFSAESRWSEAMTKGEAAILALRLKNMLERG